MAQTISVADGRSETTRRGCTDPMISSRGLSRLPSLLVLVVGTSLTACASPSSGPAASPVVPTAPEAATPTEGTPGTTPSPTQPSEPGERPLVDCTAKHPIAKLPYAAVDVDAWANALAGSSRKRTAGAPSRGRARRVT